MDGELCEIWALSILITVVFIITVFLWISGT